MPLVHFCYFAFCLCPYEAPFALNIKIKSEMSGESKVAQMYICFAMILLCFSGYLFVLVLFLLCFEFVSSVES